MRRSNFPIPSLRRCGLPVVQAITLCFLLTFSFKIQLPATQPAPPTNSPQIPAFAYNPEIVHLLFPREFTNLLHNREIIDAYQQSHYQVEPVAAPAPKTAFSTKPKSAPGFRVIAPETPAETLEFRRLNSQRIFPPRSFVAPILGTPASGSILPGRQPATPDEIAIAKLIQQSLAIEGLQATTRKCVDLLGKTSVRSDPEKARRRLAELGLPVDLLSFYLPAPGGEPVEPRQVSADRVLRLLAEDSRAETNRRLGFQFRKTAPQFEIATEDGRHAVGMLRMQAEGGWNNGLIPGGNLDAIGQLIDVFRNAGYWISTSREMEPLVSGMARNVWKWRRKDQLTLCVEEISVGTWAQDNGKGGILKPATTASPAQLATLVPRYASTGEGLSSFTPGDSYLVDGWKAAGLQVFQSPLLFQGGNLMATSEPRTNTSGTVLWLGEGEIHRNTTLGLSPGEVKEAFRMEFGANRCEVLPAVSYHLDFDVSFRLHNGALLAFVNDPMTAARLILQRASTTLEDAGRLSPSAASEARGWLASGREMDAVRVLARALPETGPANGKHAKATAALFGAHPSDDAGANLQVFLLAMDLVEAGKSDTVVSVDSKQSGRVDHLQALKDMLAAEEKLAAQLAYQGCKVVKIPSMPDLNHSINYINSIQSQEAMVIPVYGGFYSTLDQAAVRAFETAVGGTVRIFPIPCAELQRKQGGIHCVVSVYPQLPP